MKNTFKMGKKQLSTVLISGFLTALSPILLADNAWDVIKIKLQKTSSTIPFKAGRVKVENNPQGPDRMVLRVRGMEPYQRVVVFITQDQKFGGLPAQILGEFTTNRKGKGVLRIRTEIVNAFASHNLNQEDNQGIASSGQTPPAGLLVSAGGGANTIPLNFFRGYVVNGAIDNVFGPDENTAGGSPVFQSVVPLP